MTKRLFICSLALFIYTTPWAQNLIPERADHLTLTDGLPDIIITALCQDEDGFLWIGTANGLSRYDGTEFKNYYHHPDATSLPGNRINAIVALSNHRLLIGTATGLCVFNTQKSIFKNLLIPSSAKMFPFENNFQTIAANKKGNIWAGTQTCLYYIDSSLRIIKSIRSFGEKDPGKAKFLFSQDIKILPDGETLFKLQFHNGWKYYTFNQSSGQIIPVDNLTGNSLQFLNQSLVSDISFDEKGNAFFIKHLADSIFYFDAAAKKISAQRAGSNINREQFFYGTHVFRIGDGRPACALSGGGLLYWQNPPLPNGDNDNNFIALPGETVFCSINDQEKNLWLGTARGLYRFTLPGSALDITNFPGGHVTTLYGKNEIENISIINHNLFICTTAKGFYYQTNHQSWKNIIWPREPGSQNIWNIDSIDSRDYWVATQKGMYRWNKSNNSYGEVQWPKNYEWINNLPLTTLFKDSRNLIWIGLGQGNGVAVYDPEQKEMKVYAGKEFPLRYPTSITEDETGNLWMGGPDGIGLAEWNRKKNVFVLFSTAYNSSFDNGVIYQVYADHKGNVWIGTESGLIKYNINEHRFQKYYNADGLASNAVYSFTSDTSGNLWIGTKNGLNYMNLNTGRINNFSGYYHLPQLSVTALRFDAGNNKIYFAADTTLFSLTPSEWLNQNHVLKLFITGVASSGGNRNYERGTTLPYKDNNITISFTGLNLINGAGNEYFYRLNSNAKNWTALGHTRQVHFSNLPHGDYIFHVKAQTADGTWSSNEGIFSFSVASPFWKTWWFIFLFSLVAGAIVYIIYRLRIRQLLMLQQVRNRIATDLHDDIGSTLSNINILAGLTGETIDEPQKAKSFLNRIAEEAGNSSQSLDDIVWSINTVNDSFEQVAARMRRYVAEMLEGANIRYSLDFDERLSGKKLAMEQRRDVYLIFKESINNIYKHAHATVVTIELKAAKNNFLLMVHDNGQGFDNNETTNRNGLKNMRNRTQKWKGTCGIVSSPPGGTTITVTMPVS